MFWRMTASSAQSTLRHSKICRTLGSSTLSGYDDFSGLCACGYLYIASLFDFTVMLVDGTATPLNVTFVVCFKLTPVRVTEAPTGPQVGLKLVICGITRNGSLLVSLPLDVATVTNPVSALSGTVAIMNVADFTLKLAWVPLKATAVAL